MIFNKTLKWDTITISKAISDHLEKQSWKVNTSLGFADSGESAFIVTARKEKNVIVVFLENEQKEIRIKAGMAGKYLSQGNKVPQFSKVFAHTEIRKASDYFEEILEKLK